jgi:hypothetical protein
LKNFNTVFSRLGFSSVHTGPTSTVMANSRKPI